MTIDVTLPDKLSCPDKACCKVVPLLAAALAVLSETCRQRQATSHLAKLRHKRNYRLTCAAAAERMDRMTAAAVKGEIFLMSGEVYPARPPHQFPSLGTSASIRCGIGQIGSWQ